jgi:hypothetical protein
MVREMLDDPRRPRCYTRADAYTWKTYIDREWRSAGAPSDERDRYAREERAWQVAARFPSPWSLEKLGGEQYDIQVPGIVLRELFAEADAFIVAQRIEERSRPSDREASLADRVPADGPGLDYAGLAAVWGCSRRTAETRVARLLALGLIRSEEEPTARGGSARRLFWSDEGVEGDDE